MPDPVETSKPVVITAEDIKKEHLKKIAGDFNDALQKPVQSTAQDFEPAFEQEPLDQNAQKQAAEFEEVKPVVSNPPDKDSFWRHILTFRNKRVGDVEAKAMYNAKSEVVAKKGGQEKAD